MKHNNETKGQNSSIFLTGSRWRNERACDGDRHRSGLDRETEANRDPLLFLQPSAVVGGKHEYIKRSSQSTVAYCVHVATGGITGISC